MTTVELLVVVAVLGVLAAGVVFATAGVRDGSLTRGCRAEKRIVLSALESARAANVRNEYPGVGGDDGLDRVREAGFLGWDTRSDYWRYVTPPLDGELTSANLQRVGVDVVAVTDCAF